MGKGSKRRPLGIKEEEFEDNWNAIFKRDKKNTEKSRYARNQRDRKR